MAVDRPGFGLSPRLPGRTLLDWVADVRALADRWGLERFPVVGYSGGGRYALACASALPERLSLAAVVATPGPPQMPGFRANMTWLDLLSLRLAGSAPAAATALWGSIRWMAVRHPDRFVAGLAAGLSRPDREYLADPGSRASFLATIVEGFRQGVGGVVDEYAIESRPWGFALEQIRAPVRLWHGDEDRIVPLAHSIYTAGRLPGARLQVLAGVGHLLGAAIEPVVTAIAAEG